MIDWWKGSARLMTKVMGNGHLVDLTWWVPMPPLITGTGIPSRTHVGGVDVGRQLKVTARCHSTVRLHYLSYHLSCSSPSSHDGQMTIIPALLFHTASSSLAQVCSVSVIFCLKMRLCIRSCGFYNIRNINALPGKRWGISRFDKFTILWLYSSGQSAKVCVPVAKGLFVFIMKQEDGKVI